MTTAATTGSRGSRRLLRRIATASACLVIAGVVAVTLLYVWAATRTNGSLVAFGEERGYLLHVPASYDPAKPTPLVISLHGAFLYPRFQTRLTQWNALADEEGFIVVYPAAAGFPPLWRMQPSDALAAEVAFFAELIDALALRYNIDPDRVYVNGFSNGAAMAALLACSSARIAAAGLVATPVVPLEWCRHDAAVPVVAIHGVLDPFAPYAGGENFLTTEALPSLQSWLRSWAARNRCTLAPDTAGSDAAVTVSRYTACAEDASVILYALHAAGHVWPGGRKFPGNSAGPNSDSVDATRELWAFFKQHPRAAR